MEEEEEEEEEVEDGNRVVEQEFEMGCVEFDGGPEEEHSDCYKSHMMREA